ncbi:MAG: isopeptide-forming domain-containing fimbrial protein [Oscillospiraceae bacterium]
MKAKKIVSFIAAMAIAATMAVPATLSFAASTTVTFTSTVATDFSKYHAYQLFVGNYANNTLGVTGFGSSVAGKEAEFIGIVNTFLPADKQLATDALAGDVANAIAANITDATAVSNFAKALAAKGYTADSSVTFTASTEEGKTNTEATATFATDGYYLVYPETTESGDAANKDYAYSSCILLTTGAGTQTANLKVTKPSVDKNVKEDRNNTFQKSADYEIGQEIEMQLVGNLSVDATEYAKYDTYNFIFHDTYSAGLDTPSDITAAIYASDGTTKKADLTVTADTATAGKLTVDCGDIKAAGAAAGDKIIVTYKTKLNASAKVYKELGNENKVYLEYSNNPVSGGTGKTVEVPVTVATYGADISKVQTGTTTKVAGAEFYLKKGTKFAKLDSNNKLVSWEDSEATATKITTTEDGPIMVYGLDEGETYNLYESKVPDGYNEPASRDNEFTITTTLDAAWTSGDPVTSITVDHTDWTVSGSTGHVEGNIENTPAGNLPSTGGMGRTILYVVGGAVVLGAGILLITKKRLGKEED